MKYLDVAIVENLCQPSPCGPNSKCSLVRNNPVCSCLEDYVGSPPSCRPECSSDSDCPLTLSCINKKCINPCVGVCGYQAECSVIQHKATCACPNGLVGNPYTLCEKYFKPPENVPEDVCSPSPCGPYSKCTSLKGSPICSCLRDHSGTPPNCKPECISNSECSSDLSCINMKCQDPCQNACGVDSSCIVRNHVVNCYCGPNLTGNPLVKCSVPVIETVPERFDETEPCNPSPCGRNAVCRNYNGVGTCLCLPKYFGNPFVECRPECVVNSDCTSDKFCLHNECKPACSGICGENAICHEINHSPVCICMTQYTGNPYEYCSKIINRKQYCFQILNQKCIP